METRLVATLLSALMSYSIASVGLPQSKTIADTMAEAVVVKDGKILAVGSRADVETYKGAETKTVDLRGKGLLPGFLDAHSHYINSLSVARQVKLYPAPSGPGKDVPSIIVAIQKYQDEHHTPKGQLIQASAMRTSCRKAIN